MSKRDYVNFARMIRAERHKIEQEYLHFTGVPVSTLDDKNAVLDSIVESLADIFQADNEHFNRVKFIQACQLPEKTKESQ